MARVLAYRKDLTPLLVDFLPEGPAGQAALPRTGCLVVDFAALADVPSASTLAPAFGLGADYVDLEASHTKGARSSGTTDGEPSSEAGVAAAVQGYCFAAPFRVHGLAAAPLDTPEAKLDALRHIWLDYSDGRGAMALGSRATVHPVLRDLVERLRERRTLGEEARKSDLESGIQEARKCQATLGRTSHQQRLWRQRRRRRTGEGEDDEEDEEDEHEEEDDESMARRVEVEREATRLVGAWRHRYERDGLPQHFGRLLARNDLAGRRHGLEGAPADEQRQHGHTWYPFVFETHSLHLARFVVEHYAYRYATWRQKGGSLAREDDTGAPMQWLVPTVPVPIVASSAAPASASASASLPALMHRPWPRGSLNALVYLLWQLPRWQEGTAWALVSTDDVATASESTAHGVAVLPTSVDVSDFRGAGVKARATFQRDGTAAGLDAGKMAEFLGRIPVAFFTPVPPYLLSETLPHSRVRTIAAKGALESGFQHQRRQHPPAAVARSLKRPPSPARADDAPSSKLARLLTPVRPQAITPSSSSTGATAAAADEEQVTPGGLFRYFKKKNQQ